MGGIVDRIKVLIKDITLDYLLPSVYKRAVRHTQEFDKVLFLESKEEEIPDSFRLLYERLQGDQNFDTSFVTLRQNDVNLVRYGINCVGAVKAVAASSLVFLNDASDVISCLPLREGTRVVQLWHACGAFKKWGMSTADLKFGGTREQILKHPFYKNLSLVTVSSPDVSWAYVEAMDLGGQEDVVKPLGVSRTDVFFDHVFLDQAYESVIRKISACKGKKIILYAPTFRGKVSQAKAPDKLDVALFREVLEDKYVLLIKHHPFVKTRPEIPEDCREFAFDVSEDLPIDQLLSVADVCITDYSSLVFEYSLFERPVLFFAYDKEEYDDWRGFYYDFEELTPGPVFVENAPMVEYICNIDENFDCVQVGSFRSRFMSACDGRSTDRIIEEVFDAKDKTL